MTNKVKKTKKPVLINILIDESGSMGDCWNDTIEGFNAYIDVLKEKTPNAIVSVSTFDGRGIRKLCETVEIKDVPLLNKENYSPCASTPLYDAIGKIIDSGSSYIEKQKGKINSLLVIQTDGMENASSEHTKDSIKGLMKGMEDKGWTFVFLGADLDAISSVRSMGLSSSISLGNSLSYQKLNTRSVFKDTLSAATVAYCANAGSKTDNFFDNNEELGDQ